MTVGTTAEVIEAFVFPNDPDVNRVTRTASAPVPGGCRVSIEDGAGIAVLYSYRTAQAVRLPSGEIAVTPRKYTVTTSKLVGHLIMLLHSAGYVPTDRTYAVNAAVPGRWGGFGPAWHATGWEVLPFEVWEDSPEARAAYAWAMQEADDKRAEKAAAKAARRAETIGLGL